MKAHYYLSQALLAQQDFDSALAHGLEAHKLCTAAGDKSLAVITAHVLRCKKERWVAREKTRYREEADLENDMISLLQSQRREALSEAESEVARREIEGEWDAKATRLRGVFDKSRAEAEQDRVVPDWAIDDITFAIMVDPVVVCRTRPFPCLPRVSPLIRLN
jgi:STIP1 homology and U-box containing protein 1